MKPDAFLPFTLWEQPVSYHIEYGYRPCFWNPKESFKYAAVLVPQLLCFNKIWGVFVGMKECFKNKIAQLTDNQQPQVLQRVTFTEWCPE